MQKSLACLVLFIRAGLAQLDAMLGRHQALDHKLVQLFAQTVTVRSLACRKSAALSRRAGHASARRDLAHA